MEEEVRTAEILDILYNIIDAEFTTVHCCEHLADHIKNGRVKEEFYSFIKSANDSKEKLKNYFSYVGLDEYEARKHCKFCRISPESFSLIGAINLLLEIIGAAIRSYKKLLGVVSDKEIKHVIKEIIRTKVSQSNFLKREKRFLENKSAEKGIFFNYCIPDVAAKLWR